MVKARERLRNPGVEQSKDTLKNIKLQSVPPSMPSEALSVRILDIHSASSGIDGGTGCNFIFFRIAIISSNKIIVQIGENYEDNISFRRKKALFLIVLEIWNSEKLCDPF